MFKYKHSTNLGIFPKLLKLTNIQQLHVNIRCFSLSEKSSIKPNFLSKTKILLFSLLFSSTTLALLLHIFNTYPDYSFPLYHQIDSYLDPYYQKYHTHYTQLQYNLSTSYQTKKSQLQTNIHQLIYKGFKYIIIYKVLHNKIIAKKTAPLLIQLVQSHSLKKMYIKLFIMLLQNPGFIKDVDTLFIELYRYLLIQPETMKLLGELVVDKIMENEEIRDALLKQIQLLVGMQHKFFVGEGQIILGNILSVPAVRKALKNGKICESMMETIQEKLEGDYILELAKTKVKELSDPSQPQI